MGESRSAVTTNRESNVITESLPERARAFADRAHSSIDHRRKYTGEPYIVHPTEVAEIVRTVPHDEAMLAAAYLHDVVEDTPVTLAQIEHEFGPDVAALVEQLTDVSRLTDGNRAARLSLDRAHSARATPRAKTVKLADVISNTRDIARHDPGFARTYFREKRLLLDVLREGDATLYARAEAILRGESVP